MAAVKLVLRRSWEEARDTRSFAFETQGLPPAQPGQYLMLRMEAPDDPRRGSRTFTIASSPTEPDVVITTRLREGSAFKRRLASLPVGGSLEARGPMGRFTLPDEDRPLLFLAGGIGVTPFRAMIRYAMDTGRRAGITLLASDRTPDLIPYRQEMDAWARAHAWLRVERTITRPQEALQPWSGRTGRLDEDWIRSAVDGLDARIAFAAGPPAFVEDAAGRLRSLGFSDDRIRTERFAGY